MQKVNISDEITSVSEYWSQKVIAEANGQFFKVAKEIGAINWHRHDDQPAKWCIREIPDRIVVTQEVTICRSCWLSAN